MGKSGNEKDVPPQDDGPCDSTTNKANDEADDDECVTSMKRGKYKFRLRGKGNLRHKDGAKQRSGQDKSNPVTTSDNVEIPKKKKVWPAKYNKGPFICAYCSKKFRGLLDLTRHERTHTNEKPLVCTECGRGFNNETILRVHMTVHSKERPFACPHCDMRFSLKTGLKAHSAKHSDEKPYKCDICGFRMKYPASLRNHIKTHSTEKPFPCQICGKPFISQRMCSMHEKLHANPDARVNRVLKEKKPRLAYRGRGGKQSDARYEELFRNLAALEKQAVSSAAASVDLPAATSGCPGPVNRRTSHRLAAKLDRPINTCTLAASISDRNIPVTALTSRETPAASLGTTTPTLIYSMTTPVMATNILATQRKVIDSKSGSPSMQGLSPNDVSQIPKNNNIHNSPLSVMSNPQYHNMSVITSNSMSALLNSNPVLPNRPLSTLPATTVTSSVNPVKVMSNLIPTMPANNSVLLSPWVNQLSNMPYMFGSAVLPINTRMPSAAITVPFNCNSVTSSTAQFSSNVNPVFVTSKSLPIMPGNSIVLTPPSIVQLISMPALFNRIPVLPYNNQLTSLAVQSNFNPVLVTSNSLPNMLANNAALTSPSVNQFNSNMSTMFIGSSVMPYDNQLTSPTVTVTSNINPDLVTSNPNIKLVTSEMKVSSCVVTSHTAPVTVCSSTVTSHSKQITLKITSVTPEPNSMPTFVQSNNTPVTTMAVPTVTHSQTLGTSKAFPINTVTNAFCSGTSKALSINTVTNSPTSMASTTMQINMVTNSATFTSKVLPINAVTNSHTCVTTKVLPINTVHNLPINRPISNNSPNSDTCAAVPITIDMIVNSPTLVSSTAVPINAVTNSSMLTNAVTNSPVSINAVTNSPVSVNAVTNSPVSVNAVTNSPVSINAVTNSPVLINAVTNSPVAINAVTNSPVSVNAVTNSPVSVNAVTNSPVSVNAVTNSPVSINAVTNSPVLINAVANSPVAINSVTNSPVPLNVVTNSPTSVTAAADDLDNYDDAVFFSFTPLMVIKTPFRPGSNNVVKQ